MRQQHSVAALTALFLGQSGLAAAQSGNPVDPREQRIAAHQQEEKRDEHHSALEQQRPGGHQRRANGRGSLPALGAELRFDLAEVAEPRQSLVCIPVEWTGEPLDQAGHAFAAHRFLDELHPRGRLLDHERGQADQRTDQQHQHREDQKSRGELGSPAQLCGNSRCSGASTAASTIARSSASARGQTTAPTSSKLPISNTNRKRRAVRPCVIALLLETDRLHVALRLCDGGIHPG